MIPMLIARRKRVPVPTASLSGYRDEGSFFEATFDVNLDGFQARHFRLYTRRGTTVNRVATGGQAPDQSFVFFYSFTPWTQNVNGLWTNWIGSNHDFQIRLVFAPAAGTTAAQVWADTVTFEFRDADGNTTDPFTFTRPAAGWYPRPLDPRIVYSSVTNGGHIRCSASFPAGMDDIDAVTARWGGTAATLLYGNIANTRQGQFHAWDRLITLANTTVPWSTRNRNWVAGTVARLLLHHGTNVQDEITRIAPSIEFKFRFAHHNRETGWIAVARPTQGWGIPAGITASFEGDEFDYEAGSGYLLFDWQASRFTPRDARVRYDLPDSDTYIGVTDWQTREGVLYGETARVGAEPPGATDVDEAAWVDITATTEHLRTKFHDTSLFRSIEEAEVQFRTAQGELSAWMDVLSSRPHGFLESRQPTVTYHGQYENAGDRYAIFEFETGDFDHQIKASDGSSTLTPLNHVGEGTPTTLAADADDDEWRALPAARLAIAVSVDAQPDAIEFVFRDMNDLESNTIEVMKPEAGWVTEDMFTAATYLGWRTINNNNVGVFVSVGDYVIPFRNVNASGSRRVQLSFEVRLVTGSVVESVGNTDFEHDWRPVLLAIGDSIGQSTGGLQSQIRVLRFTTWFDLTTSPAPDNWQFYARNTSYSFAQHVVLFEDRGTPHYDYAEFRFREILSVGSFGAASEWFRVVRPAGGWLNPDSEL